GDAGPASSPAVDAPQATASVPPRVPPVVEAATPGAVGDEPETGSKPRRFWIGERSFAVKAWRDLPVHTCNLLAEARPDPLQRAFDDEEFQGHKRRALARTAEGMRSPAAVPGGFVEVASARTTACASSDGSSSAAESPRPPRGTRREPLARAMRG